MNNLYEIRFIHYAPKGSQEGILTYLVADSDEIVYEWLKSDPYLSNGDRVYTCWSDHEDDEWDKGFKERIISCKGDMYDDESEVSDLYYGAIQHGWKMVKSNISEEEADLIYSYVQLCFAE